jgi:rhodanese-related sulfurtransferase
MSENAGSVGELPALEAYGLLQTEADAVLIDVRTAAEWAYVGLPDLSALGKEPVCLEWQSYPSMQRTEGFTEMLARLAAARGLSKAAPLLFLCRSGVRSLAAAQAMAQLGYARCLNIRGGFEGPLDAQRQRGRVDGWKAAGLPWRQS